MKSKVLTMLLACLSFTLMVQGDIANPLRSSWNKQAPPPPTIKVLIVHDQEAAQLEVRGKYKIVDPNKNAPLISTRFVGKGQLIQAMSGGLKWGEEFPGVFQIELIPMAPETQILVNGTPYQGTIQVYDIGGTISIVNDVLIEDYLKSLLADKYAHSLPDEALAALVIANRTNAYFYSQFPKTRFWSVDGIKEGYRGSINPNPNAPIQKAINNTRYMVLSKTSLYEGVVTPFAIQPSLIALNDVEEMAKKGSHAATILDKFFPKTTIQLVRFNER